MINEVFDDEIPDYDEIIVDPPAEPKGDFKRVLAGREIWLNAPIPGQFHAWKRYRASLAAKFEVVKVKAKKNPNLEVLRELAEMSEKFDLTTLELVESLIVDPDDIEFIQFEMISGRVTMNDIHQVLFGDPGPEDDVEPVQAAPKPKKASVRKVPAKKATANVSRVKR